MNLAVKSFRIEKELHKKVRIYCIQNDLTLGELITKVLRRELGVKRLQSM